MKTDILFIAAHPDDVELCCAGTVFKHVAAGHTIAIVDLTAGELGTRGNAALRAEEAAKASAIMGIAIRENLGSAMASLTSANPTSYPSSERFVNTDQRSSLPTLFGTGTLTTAEPPNSCPKVASSPAFPKSKWKTRASSSKPGAQNKCTT
jgi:hypothetical protein